MNTRFFKYLLVFSVAFAAKTSAIAKNRAESTLCQRIFGPSSFSNRETSNNPYIYFLGSGNSAQIYRSQTLRTASFFKTPYVHINKYRAYYKSLNQIFGLSNTGYVRSCKLILFPFHVFW